jgi:hypothetical protein
MYRFGDNPSHALISLTPIVDDSGAQVEWPFMAQTVSKRIFGALKFRYPMVGDAQNEAFRSRRRS